VHGIEACVLFVLVLSCAAALARN